MAKILAWNTFTVFCLLNINFHIAFFCTRLGNYALYFTIPIPVSNRFNELIFVTSVLSLWIPDHKKKELQKTPYGLF